MSPGIFLWRLQAWQLSSLPKEGAGEADDGWSSAARRRQQGGHVKGVYIQGEKLVT